MHETTAGAGEKLGLSIQWMDAVREQFASVIVGQELLLRRLL